MGAGNMTMTDTSVDASPIVGIAPGDGILLDLIRLIETRLIVQANKRARFQHDRKEKEKSRVPGIQ